MIQASMIYSRGVLYLVGAWLVLTVPFRWLAAFGFSCLVHEFGHFAALHMCGVKIRSWRIGFRGMRLFTEPMQRKQELICALAGPVIGFLPVLLQKVFPCLAVCALFHTLYNLLPLHGLDGYRVINALSTKILGKSAGRMFTRSLSAVTAIGLLLVGIWFSFVLRLGILGFLPGICGIRKLFALKRPCKVNR